MHNLYNQPFYFKTTAVVNYPGILYALSVERFVWMKAVVQRRKHYLIESQIGNLQYASKCGQMPRDKRPKRDLHALNEEGMVLCNPRDKEAALRAQTEGIATEDWSVVTCRKCLLLVHKRNKALQQRHLRN